MTDTALYIRHTAGTSVKRRELYSPSVITYNGKESEAVPLKLTQYYKSTNLKKNSANSIWSSMKIQLILSQ